MVPWTNLQGENGGLLGPIVSTPIVVANVPVIAGTVGVLAGIHVA